MGTGLFEVRGFVAEGLRDEGLRDEGREEGRLQEQIRSLRRVLEAHKVSPSDDAWRRVTACQDSELLALWFERALTSATPEEIFGAPAPEAPAPEAGFPEAPVREAGAGADASRVVARAPDGNPLAD